VLLAIFSGKPAKMGYAEGKEKYFSARSFFTCGWKKLTILMNSPVVDMTVL